ncbi:HTH-type transcriptional regulator GlpR [Halapricum desulfuricans]|nr:HTH-type transcriptional regulator GlpR [Halapricum desulfuricans]
MLPEKRRRTIVDLVNERGGCSVSELAEELDYSKPTIRRDLTTLEQEGLIDRSHGGAVPVDKVGAEQSYRQREIRNLESKQAIADRAIEEVLEDEIAFFDGGTTTMQIAKRMPEDRSYVAVTNSPLLADELVTTADEVKLTGGTLRGKTRALVGPTAEQFMHRTNFDLVFLGTNGIAPDAGLSTPSEDEAEIKSLMVENAKRVILVSDASKFGQRSFAQFAELADVDLLITDEDPPASLRSELDGADVSTIVTRHP